MLYNFIPQTEHPKILCTGKLSMADGTAYFISDGKIVETIFRAKVDTITPYGVHISGFLHRVKNRKAAYIYREWYCSYKG